MLFVDWLRDWVGHGRQKMKRSIALSALLIIGFLAGSTGTGSAVVYCQYAGYPANCVVRPGVVVAPSHEPRRIPPSIDARPSLIRQDLFDRNNPNNLRSDWPSPPAQPGQFWRSRGCASSTQTAKFAPVSELFRLSLARLRHAAPYDECLLPRVKRK